ncbi:MAG TPA: hypothetical protein VE596_08475 [Gaiellaceae bacterium]|jgi:hypothetical protein|nr:hypothetical protein [Gaiellaceae bacterium]
MSGAWIVAFALLASLVGLLAVLFFALARFVAALATRLPQAIPLELSQGPPVGSRLDELLLPDPVARLVRGSNGDAPDSLALVFLSTSCAACQTMVSALNRFARDERGLRLVTVVSGRGAEAERMVQALAIRNRLLDPDGAAARAFGVSTVPFAFMYEQGALKAKGVVNDRDMLENLAAGQTRKEGDQLVESFARAHGEH